MKKGIEFEKQNCVETNKPSFGRISKQNNVIKSKVKVSRDRPRWPKGFRVV